MRGAFTTLCAVLTLLVASCESSSKAIKPAPRRPTAVVSTWSHAMRANDGRAACAITGARTLRRLGGRAGCERIVASGRVGGPAFGVEGAYFNRSSGALAYVGVFSAWDRRGRLGVRLVRNGGATRVEWHRL